jgi:release factor glutamine methyltransferase
VRVDAAVVWGASRLTEAGVEAPRRTALWLLEHAVGITPTAAIAHPDRMLAGGERAAFVDAVERRASGVPLQHIVGEQEFHGLAFEVTPDVLIPRPETEILVDAAIARWRMKERDRASSGSGNWIVDVGAGSGCIPVVLARECAGARVAAVDVSERALVVARRNAARHGADVRFVQSDLLSALGGPFAIVTANLPYIPDDEIATLQREVRDHDPRLALAGGLDGLDLYRLLLADASRVLAPDGVLFCEIGIGQAEAFGRIVADVGLRLSERIDDVAGIPRVMVVTRE